MVVGGGAAVAGGLVLAFLRRLKAGAGRVRVAAHRRPIAVPSSDARARFGAVSVVGFTEHPHTLASASSLRAMIQTVIADARAPVTVRNACHHLMVAVEKNNQTLVDESVANSKHVAARIGYPLPLVPQVETCEPPLNPHLIAPRTKDSRGKRARRPL